jgi:hypothetical protein
MYMHGPGIYRKYGFHRDWHWQMMCTVTDAFIILFQKCVGMYRDMSVPYITRKYYSIVHTRHIHGTDMSVVYARWSGFPGQMVAPAVP